MKCLDDSCDSAVEKVNADESQVRRPQVFVYLDDRNSPSCLSLSKQKHPSVHEAEGRP